MYRSRSRHRLTISFLTLINFFSFKPLKIARLFKPSPELLGFIEHSTQKKNFVFQVILVHLMLLA
jgi:hypothetical protein